MQQIADRISVMYLGKVVELAGARDINERLMHPYTEALFSAMPLADSAAAARHRIVLSGEIPSAIGSAAGLRVRIAMRI